MRKERAPQHLPDQWSMPSIKSMQILLEVLILMV
jgi:hypothetical protein